MKLAIGFIIVLEDNICNDMRFQRETFDCTSHFSGLIAYRFHRIFCGVKGLVCAWWSQTPANRRALKTTNPIQTPGNPILGGSIRSTHRHPAVATTFVRDYCRKSPHPIITPSPMNTRPLIIWRTLAMYEGIKAVSCTSWSGVDFCNNSNKRIWREPSVAPRRKPQLISLLTVTLAIARPPSLSPVVSSNLSTIAFSITVCATVERASSTILPNWNTFMAMVKCCLEEFVGSLMPCWFWSV